MTNQHPQFKTVVKDQLFYNRFELAIGFQLHEVNCLRNLSHSHIDTMIERRIAWREVAQQRWQKANNSFGNILTRRTQEITEHTVANLHSLADILLSTVADFKLVVTANHAHVYTNDMELLLQLDQLSCLNWKTYSRAVIDRPKDTIRLKNPQHRWRSYFKNSKITAEQKRSIKNFLAMQEGIRLSPALLVWLDGAFLRTSDYFFVDHNEMSWLTMLSLVHSSLIRKTQQIIPANK